MTPQPMIVVHDVRASSAWYQRALGLASGHGGDEYEQLVDAGALVLQLHRWDAHEHPQLGDPARRPYGNGVLLWFATARFDDALARIRDSGATVIEGPLVNPNAGHREIWLQDPDGYKVVVAGPRGDLGGGSEDAGAVR